MTSLIDRIGPTVRPARRVIGYQQWRDLLFLHWAVPVDSLRPLVPSSLELDLYEGAAYVGVVPFRMLGVRSRWWPPPIEFEFLETNVRTYVHYRGRPGIYFFSLDAASWLAVLGARWLWGLPYFHAHMDLRRDGDTIQYETRRKASGARHFARYRPGAPLGPSLPGSLEHFFLERYLLFVTRRGRLFEGRVHHQPYPAQAAEVLDLHDELVSAAGLSPVQHPPKFAHYAAGVDVEIFSLRGT